MSTEKRSCRRVSLKQVDMLLDIMGQTKYLEIAVGYARTTEARHKYRILWQEITRKLNSCAGGCVKSDIMWSRYWTDMKSKLKFKIKQINMKSEGTIAAAPVLTDLEEKALKLLKLQYKKKIQSVVVHPCNPLNPISANDSPTELQLDVYHENDNYIRKMTEFCFVEENIDDGKETDEEMEEKSMEEKVEVIESNCEYETNEPDLILCDPTVQTIEIKDSDPTFNDAELQRLYPKWLLKVERKRSNAELIRSKAEEQRVLVDAKYMKSSLMQTEALKKLSEAMKIQADAMKRIAGILEMKAYRDSVQYL